MDDVLASIRRIVRTEKQVGNAEVIVPVDERRGEGSDGDLGDAGPLVLTPEMRVDGPAAGSAPLPDREALRSLVREIVLEELDTNAAEEAVRQIIRDELTTGTIGDNISQNVLRLIREEVARSVAAR